MYRFLFACLLCLSVPLVSLSAAAEPDTDWQPTSEYKGRWDWIQMTSGEWVKGEIIVMYDGSLEFDSDEFDDLTLDWDDIQQIRSSRVMQVGFERRESAVGLLIVEGDRVRIIADEGVREFHRDDILSLTAGAPKEINYWSMKVFIGFIIRSGNSDVNETNVQANFKRRTIRNRMTFDFVGNLNRTDGESVSDNQRGTASWDKFINKRFFVRPVFGEYFRDPFQNIKTRYTVGVGAGYQLLDTKKVDWEVSGGPAYQETHFETVETGTLDHDATPALTAETRANWDILKWLEFDGLYRFQIVNEESGRYNHHLVASLETEITSLLDFDVSWIWDRIDKPRPDSSGVTPQSDDFRTTVGLTFDF